MGAHWDCQIAEADGLSALLFTHELAALRIDLGPSGRVRSVDRDEHHLWATVNAVGPEQDREVLVELRVTLGRAPRDLVIEVRAHSELPLEMLAFPHISCRSRTHRWSHWLVPDGEGLRIPIDSNAPGRRDRVCFWEHRITLPAVALLAEAGPAILVGTQQGHDHGVMLEWSPDPDGGVSFTLLNAATLGRWGYSRFWSITVLEDSRVESVAASVRESLLANGASLLPQSDKLELAQVAETRRKAVGGSHLWCHFDSLTSSLMDHLELADVQSVLIMGRPADAAAAEHLAASRYAGGPYFQSYDVFPPGQARELSWRGVYPPEGSSDGWPTQLIRDRLGWLDPGWIQLPADNARPFWLMDAYLKEDGTWGQRATANHHELMVRSYRRCPRFHKSLVESRALPLLGQMDASAVFFDIATAIWDLECFDPDHPVARSEDIPLRIEILDLLRSRGLVTNSESGKWWAIDHVNGFEGMLSYDFEDNVNCMQLTDYPVDPARDRFEFDMEHRVPLFGLVARECVSRTMWWGRGQDRHPETWHRKDALTAVFGANPIFVVDPEHPFALGSLRTEQMLETMRTFDRLKAETHDQRLVSYEGADGLARASFEGGITVEVNCGLDVADGLKSGDIHIRDTGGRMLHKHRTLPVA